MDWDRWQSQGRLLFLNFIILSFFVTNWGHSVLLKELLFFDRVRIIDFLIFINIKVQLLGFVVFILKFTIDFVLLISRLISPGIVAVSRSVIRVAEAI